MVPREFCRRCGSCHGHNYCPDWFSAYWQYETRYSVTCLSWYAPNRCMLMVDDHLSIRLQVVKKRKMSLNKRTRDHVRLWHIVSVIEAQRNVRSWMQAGSDRHVAKDFVVPAKAGIQTTRRCRDCGSRLNARMTAELWRDPHRPHEICSSFQGRARHRPTMCNCTSGNLAQQLLDSGFALTRAPE